MTSQSAVGLTNRQPTVIGISGLPAAGKSFILEALRKDLVETEFTFFEGSEWRIKAINHIRDEVATSGRIAIVTGHLMFWSEVTNTPYAVYTPEDFNTFTHIIYLAPDEKTIASHIESDEKKNPEEVLPLVQHFKQLAPAGANLAQVKKRFDEIIALHDNKKLQTFLVFDGDRTLTAEDGGRLLVDEMDENGTGQCDSAMRDLYSGPMGYSDKAFHQATLILEEECTDDMFEDRCDTVSAFIPLYTEFLTLLRRIAQQKHIGPVIVTCGVGRLWKKILKHHGLSDSVKVIGGGRLSGGYFVTPAVKAAVVSHLRDVHDLNVWAFGYSPLDVPMLCEADQVVVVGDEKTRSSTMDASLAKTIQDGHLRARQILLPSTSSPRLDKDSLPVISLSDKKFVKSITDRRKELLPLRSYDATNKTAAKILMSPMRDAAVAGLVLGKAHANVGRYLATEYVSKIIRLEECTIPHTSIVALMRGGEPMAFGISDVFPQAMFIHASSPEDVRMHHVQGQSNAILVDSVVNSGKSVIEFIKRVARLEPNINITVVAGVVQSETVVQGHIFEKVMRRHGAGSIALRISGNKFTGTKTTDTGNRLFSTTHLA
ncbi:uracil phosphoribosyltransferase-domain-containing protein [Fusarium oxysporum]|nr:uracil phosphoribosyltransferase-domain-containing protein [Fusarium oxysporum]